jgi:hypothetical protein
VIWSVLFLTYILINLLLELLFGNIEFSDATVILQKIKWQENAAALFAICLGVGALTALLIRFLESRGVKLDDSITQAEIFNSGLYLTSYGYVNGMHPFFAWGQINHIDKKKKRGRIDLTIHLLHQAKPSKLSFDIITAAEIIAIPELQLQPNNPLSKTLSDLLGTP